MRRILFLGSLGFILLATGLPGFGQAQDQSCSYTLKEAQQLYQQGLIEKIPSLLSACMQSGFTRQERQDAYKLILLCYLFDDNQSAADSDMLLFLRKYPEYEINPTDPKEFVYLFNTYTNPPVFGLGLIGGYTIPQFFVTESNSTNDLNGTARQYKRSGSSYQFGLQINTTLVKQYELGLGIVYSACAFQTVDKISLFSPIPNETRTYTESQSRIEFPVFVRYNYELTKKIIPYARLGVVPIYMLSATGTVARVYTTGTPPDNSPSLDVLKLRNPFGMSLLAGIGVKFRIPRGFIFADLKYQPGITSQLNSSYVNQQLSSSSSGSTVTKLAWTYGMMLDNFRLNELTVSIGYAYSFYNPKKKRQ